MNFLPIVFERISCLEKAISSYTLEGVTVLENDPLDHIPLDMLHFTTLQEEDRWDEHLFFSILKLLGFNKIVVKKESKVKTDGLKEERRKRRKRKRALRILKKTAIGVASFLASKNDYFIVSPYLNRMDNIQLDLKLLRFQGLQGIAAP